jgi:putative transposase
MTRPLRIEYPGALYHVTSRGDRKGTIFFDDNDRNAWMDVLSRVCTRYNFVVHAYCQMTNHYHLLVETPDGNLSQGMRQLNGIYTQRVNRRHVLSGHVLHGRYKAIVVQKESYLLEVARYIVLNPVRGGMVSLPDAWPWSSYHATAGLRPPPAWLDTAWLSAFSKHRDRAELRYRRFVLQGIGRASPMKRVLHQMILGDDEFASLFTDVKPAVELIAVSKIQRRLAALPLCQYREQYATRDEAMARAYWSTAYTMAAIGNHFGVGYSTVSRAIQKYAKASASWT